VRSRSLAAALDTQQVAFNERTRKLGKKLFAASSLGLDGWVFADLLDHEYIIERIVRDRATDLDSKVPTKITATYTPFSSALAAHSFTKTKPRQLKRTPPGIFACLALFEAQLARQSQGNDPGAQIDKDEMHEAAHVALSKAGVDPALVPSELLERTAGSVGLDFSPTCAVIGGLVGQDVLNVLGGKEEPLRNFVCFDGAQGCVAPAYALGL